MLATRIIPIRWGLRELAVVLALFPGGLGLLAHSAIPSVPMSISTPDRAALAFDQYVVDLGTVGSSQEVKGTFVFENRGKTTVKIQNATPSCGCLTPQLSSRELAPGATGAVVVRMQPASEMPGRKEYTVDLEYLDPLPQTARVTFRLEIPEKQLAVRPRALIVYQLSDQPTQHTISVSDTRHSPCKVTHATVNHPAAHVAVKNVEQSADFGQVTNIEVTIDPSLTAGRHEGLVTVHTDDPTTPLIRVPLLLHGRSQP